MEVDEFSERARRGNVIRLYEETVVAHGNDLAIEMHGREITHDELHASAGRFAGGVRELGLEPDDRALLYLPNCPEYLTTVFGGFRAGVPLSPANPQYRSRELSYQIEDTDAKAIITHAGLRGTVTETLEETDVSPTIITVADDDADVPSDDIPFDDVAGDPIRTERDDDDVAVQPYTSGTTGRPKGVLITHRNLRTQAFAGIHGDLPPGDVRSLIWLPMYHITGLTHCAFQPLIGGGAVFVRDPADWDGGEAMRTIEDHAITSFIGVAAMYVDMVEDDAFGAYDLSSLETANEGGAKMPVAVQREFEETTGVGMVEGYGLTETCGATHVGSDTTFGHKIGTVGQPLRMTDSKIVDDDGEEVPSGEEGELLVRGPQVMKGYHDRPEANAAAFTDLGYFRTGDIARRDSDNYYEIVDRKKHVIVTAGYNVYPSEVEELLHEHPAVAQAAVVGVPDDRRNEIPKAFIVPRSGYEPGVDVTEDDLKEYCLDNLAAYKHPRAVAFLDELPRTASGKIQKFKLQDDHAETA